MDHLEAVVAGVVLVQLLVGPGLGGDGGSGVRGSGGGRGGGVDHGIGSEVGLVVDSTVGSLGVVGGI